MAALVLAWAIATAASAQRAASAATSLVFDGVTVVDVEQGKLVPDQRVVIVGNRIQAVGGAGTVKLPAGAEVVDARGKYLIPGLWDLHTHAMKSTDLFYPLFLANGVTGIRDAGSDRPLGSLIAWRQEILAGTRTGPPRQLHAGGLVTNSMTPVGLKARGANLIKLYPFNYHDAAAARRAGIPFGGHVGERHTVMEASDSGMTIIDHVSAGGGELAKRCLGNRLENTASVERCRPVAERFRQNNTWWVPTILISIWTGGSNNASPANPGAAANVVRDRFLQVAERFWSGSLPKSHWLHDVVSGGRTDSLRFLSIAQQVGLPILAGTDVMEALVKQLPPGFAIHAELAFYVTEGLTPLEALQTATLNPAKLLGGTDSLGTVATGKLADLVLLDANPLADITNTTTIRGVVANGRYFDRAALDSLLAEVQAKGR